MILEIADIRVRPGQQAAFDEAIQRGLRTVIAHAKGFQGFKVNKGIESPERYILQIFWDTLEDHTVGFRESPAFTGLSRTYRHVRCQCSSSRITHDWNRLSNRCPTRPHRLLNRCAYTPFSQCIPLDTRGSGARTTRWKCVLIRVKAS